MSSQVIRFWGLGGDASHIDDARSKAEMLGGRARMAKRSLGSNVIEGNMLAYIPIRGDYGIATQCKGMSV